MENKFRYITLDDLEEGLECEMFCPGEYDDQIQFISSEAASNYYLNQHKNWYYYKLTIKDIEDLKKFTGDYRTSPGLPLSLFRVIVS